MKFDDAMKQFLSADYDLPVDALRWCREKWSDVLPPLLDKLKKYSINEDISNDDMSIGFFSIFMMAEAREVRAFAPLCRLAHNSTRLTDILGKDAVSEQLARILINTFDGNVSKLINLVKDKSVSEEVRDQSLDALTWLAATGCIDRDKMVSWLRGLPLTLPFEAPSDWLWSGWARSVALLGLEDMTPLVIAAAAEGRMNDIWFEPEEFHRLMNATCNDPNRMAGFAHTKIRPFTDVISELSEWYAFSAKRKADDEMLDEDN